MSCSRLADRCLSASPGGSLRRLTGSEDLLGASLAAAVAAFEHGATILRVHDVRPTVDALTVAAAVA